MGPPTKPDPEASRNRIDYLANLDTEAKLGKSFRRTSIICTIGKTDCGYPTDWTGAHCF